MSRRSRATKQRGLDNKPPGRTLIWRTASFRKAHELLVEAADAEANQDPIRRQAAIERMRSLPGFPRDMKPNDRLLIEEIPPIIAMH